MQNINIQLDDIVIMKKPHACGDNKWKVIRLGVDLKLKCLNCGHEIMISRIDFNKKFKKKVDENNA
jgi:hypothetical protein